MLAGARGNKTVCMKDFNPSAIAGAPEKHVGDCG
jgi:hypothetical protein